MVKKLRWSQDHLPYMLLTINHKEQGQNRYLAASESEREEEKENGTLENKTQPIYDVACQCNVKKLFKALKHCKEIENTPAFHAVSFGLSLTFFSKSGSTSCMPVCNLLHTMRI